MNWHCPNCNTSLKYRMLGARYAALNKTLYRCPACKRELRQVPYPQHYNLLTFRFMLPVVPAIKLLLSDQVFSAAWWALPAVLGIASLLGARWSLRSIPKDFRRYEET